MGLHTRRSIEVACSKVTAAEQRASIFLETQLRDSWILISPLHRNQVAIRVEPEPMPGGQHSHITTEGLSRHFFMGLFQYSVFSEEFSILFCIPFSLLFM